MSGGSPDQLARDRTDTQALLRLHQEWRWCDDDEQAALLEGRLLAEFPSLVARLSEMERALERYGKHDTFCRERNYHDAECDCGFAAALAAGRGEHGGDAA